MRTDFDKLNEEITLTMTKDEAAYLHAFLGQFSNQDYMYHVKDALVDQDDTTFLAEGFNVDKFGQGLVDEGMSYYFSLDHALTQLRDATL